MHRRRRSDQSALVIPITGLTIEVTMKARWRLTLEGSKDEALLAVDLYNQAKRPRRLEAYFVHMHLAWLYLFEAQYQRQRLDYHFRLPNGRYERVDGEPRTWDLAKFVHKELSEGDADQAPVRKNLELTISLRNKIEHRFEEATTVATAGYAQSLLLNYEERLTRVFGKDATLGPELRFPIFLGTLTREGAVRLAQTQQTLPKRTREFLDSFESGMNPSVAQDHRYEFRVRLLPKIGSKTDADLAVTFVRDADLSDQERALMESLDRSGTVIVREQVRSVSNEDLLKPGQVAAAVEKRIPYRFRVHPHFVRAWKKEAVRPPEGDAHPERTKQDFCIFDRAHRDYLYTSSFVDFLVEHAKTKPAFRELTGTEPTRKDEKEKSR